MIRRRRSSSSHKNHPITEGFHLSSSSSRETNIFVSLTSATKATSENGSMKKKSHCHPRVMSEVVIFSPPPPPQSRCQKMVKKRRLPPVMVMMTKKKMNLICRLTIIGMLMSGLPNLFLFLKLGWLKEEPHRDELGSPMRLSRRGDDDDDTDVADECSKRSCQIFG